MIWFAFAIVAAFAAAGVDGASIPDREVAVLRDFHASTGGAHWQNNSGWLSAEIDPCQWFGVVCKSGHVDALFLARNGLEGTLPESIGDLSEMTAIDVGTNSLHGTLPQSFSALRKMYAISFRFCNLSGPLRLSMFTELLYAHFDFNRFDGTLAGLSDSLKLKVIGLTDNNIEGEIPAWFAGITTLETVFLGGNKLSGEIPAFKSSHIKALDLGRNRLSGKVPARTMLQLPEVVEVLAGNNKLEGSLDNAPKHQNLVVFDLHGNGISGELPGIFADGFPNLDILRLQNNALSGFVPEEFARTAVPDVDLSGNPFFCPLPTNASDKTKAVCRFWDTKSIYPTTSPMSGGRIASISGSDFILGMNIFCMFGQNGPETMAKVSTSRTSIFCDIPAVKKSGKVEVFVVFNHIPINTKGRLFITFTAAAGPAPSPQPARVAAPPVPVVILGMSKCPDMASIEEIFTPILQDLTESVVNLTIGWIARKSPDYPTGYWALHGQTEMIGNALTSCTIKHYGMTGALVFANCMNKQQGLIPSNSHKCATELGLDDQLLQSCALGPEGAKLVADGVVLADQYHAVWCPTIWLNGEFFCLWDSAPCKATTGADFKKAICEAYTGPRPAACGS